jgi:hypothetical protein
METDCGRGRDTEWKIQKIAKATAIGSFSNPGECCESAPVSAAATLYRQMCRSMMRAGEP